MGKLKNVLVIASGSSIAELTCGAAQALGRRSLLFTTARGIRP